MSKNRLYKAEFVSGPDEAYRFVPVSEATVEELWQSVDSVYIMGVQQYKIPISWEPEGWREFAIERWGENVERRDDDGDSFVMPYMPFFWPKTGVIVRTRSTAQKTVDIIRRWGGTAELMECTPAWEATVDANARRKRERNAPKIARLKAELERLEQA